MATQQNATTLDGLTAQTEKAIEGIHTEGAALNIQDMEAVLTNGLTALTTARTTCADAKAVQSQKQGDQRLAFKTLRTLIIAVMAVFKVYFGARWNGQWEVLELPVGTLTVPKNKDRLLGIAERLERYLDSESSQGIAVDRCDCGCPNCSHRGSKSNAGRGARGQGGGAQRY